MRQSSVTIQFHFCAAHWLPAFEGKCSRNHGHNYVLNVTVKGPIQEAPNKHDSGMVMEFDVLKEAVEELLAELDHFALNDVLPQEFQPGTTENFAWYLFAELHDRVAGLQKVELHETYRSWVTVTLEDFLAHE